MINLDEKNNLGVSIRLEKIRIILGFTDQKQFAKYLEIEYHRYNKWALGDNYPNVIVMTKLKAMRGITLDWIYAGDPSGLPNNIYKSVMNSELEKKDEDDT